jgi:hypothetical protein
LLSPFSRCMLTPWGLAASVTGSGTKTLKRKSSSFVPLCLLWGYFPNREGLPLPFNLRPQRQHITMGM